jgi:hypothetical protein
MTGRMLETLESDSRASQPRIALLQAFRLAE